MNMRNHTYSFLILLSILVASFAFALADSEWIDTDDYVMQSATLRNRHKTITSFFNRSDDVVPLRKRF